MAGWSVVRGCGPAGWAAGVVEKDRTEGTLACGECGLHVSLDEAERTGRRLHSDGLGELLSFCVECNGKEFGES